MKTKFLKLTSVILALFMLVSCVPNSTDTASSDITNAESQWKEDNEFLNNQFDSYFTATKFDDLSEEMKSEISKCVQKDNYEYQEGQYFGTYNGYDVVLISQIDGVEYRDAQLQKIAEYGYRIGDTEKLIAYRDNSYISLSEAYNNGSITKDDIQNICYLYQYYFYHEFEIDCVMITLKRQDKFYTKEDFSAVNCVGLKGVSNTMDAYVYLPIKNRRNALNAIEELEKLDYVVHATYFNDSVGFD